MEMLLRAAAKKRRDEAGAPFELHPADRRLLQGEVARQFASARREPRSWHEVLGQLWPRFAWAFAILGILGVAVWCLLPVSSRNAQTALLARKDMKAAVPAAASATPPSAQESLGAPAAGGRASAPSEMPVLTMAEPATAPQLVARDSSAAKSESVVREKRPLAASAPLADRRKAATGPGMVSGSLSAPPPASSANKASRQQDEFASTAVAGRPDTPTSPGPGVEAPGMSPAAVEDKATSLATKESDSAGAAHRYFAAAASDGRPASAVATAEGLSVPAAKTLRNIQSPGVVQRFVQAAPGTAAKTPLAYKAKPAQPVLASFQVEQADSELRITDGDGSVYAGYVQAVDAVQRARLAKATGGAIEQGTVANRDLEPLAPQNYFFRVVGTNRTLRKQVVFTGNLIAITNSTQLPSANTNLAFGTRPGDLQTSPHRQNFLPLLNSRIAGKLVVGSGKAIEINALPAGP